MKTNRKTIAKKGAQKTKNKVNEVRRKKREIEMTRYWADMTPEHLEEENRLGLAMAAASAEVNYDAD